KAVQTKNLAQYLEAARALYPLVRDYDVKHPPFGSTIFAFILANRLDVFDTFDFQCEVLTDQLTMYKPTGNNRTIAEALNATVGRPGWQWANWPAADKARITKLNDLLAKAVQDQLAKKQFWPQCFEWFRMTRRGNGWQDQAVHADIVETMITQKT